MSRQSSGIPFTAWLRGARLRTLPLAFGPVLLGTASAWNVQSFEPVMAILALIVSVSLQVGVNYANDYSDGIRGTDAFRLGPARLTGSGRVDPRLVKRAAFFSFSIAVLSGVALIARAGAWGLLVLGALALWAAWTYTGGTRPYGYRGLGELVVFIFFGPVATVGTAFVQAGFIPWESIVTGSSMGFFAAAVLMMNNLRDIGPDEQAGKRTLSVHIGADASKRVITVFLAIPYALLLLLVHEFPWTLMVIVTGVLAILAGAKVWIGSSSQALISALQITSAASLVYAVSLTAVMIFW